MSDEPTSKTQIIAIYGKGGIGKSFHARQPQPHDGRAGQARAADRLRPEVPTTPRRSSSGGKACPTIIETSTKKKLAGEEVKIGDVCFKRGGVFRPWNSAAPEVGARGCGGRGIIHGFELLEKLGFHDWDFDFVLLDFLGDVGLRRASACPSPATWPRKVHSRRVERPPVALRSPTNVCSAVEILPQARRQCRRRGPPSSNKDDGSGEAQALRRGGQHPRSSPRSRRTTTFARSSANYQIVGTAASEWVPLFAELGLNVSEAPPDPPRPHSTRTGFSPSSTRPTTGGGVTPEPGDRRGTCAAPNAELKASLEVIYDEV